MSRGAVHRDPAARQRLLDAQRRESAALASVFSANQGVARALDRRQTALQKADRHIEECRNQQRDRRVELVRISGLERAALLMAIPVAELKEALRASRVVENGKAAHPAEAAPNPQPRRARIHGRSSYASSSDS